MYVSYFLSLHPSAFHYTPPTNPSSWSCPSPQLHLTLSIFHACSLLFTPLSASTLSSDKNEGVERRQRWKCERAEGEREKKLRRSEKAREAAQEVDQAKNVLVINRHRFCINFWQPSSPFTPPFIPPFTPPSARPRSPLQKSNEKHALYTAWEAKCLSPSYVCFVMALLLWIMSKENFPQKVDRLFILFDNLNWTSK